METFTKALAMVKVPRNDFSRVNNVKCDYGNWVIPGRLMCGPTPGPTTYFPIVGTTEYQSNMDNIIGDGINVIVCLQQELHPSSYQHLIKGDVQVIHYPIKDDDIPTKTALLTHIAQLLQLLTDGKNIYVHCAGGHGRTSLYVACLLACLYKELRHIDNLLYYVQSVHNLRRKQKMQFYGMLPCVVCCSPVQRELLKDFLTLLAFL